MINPFHSLQWKFTLYLAVLIAATVSVIAWWSISRERTLMEKAIVREGEALVESLAISCTNTMLYEDIGLVEEGGLLDNYISDLMQRKGLSVIYAIILDPKGKVIAHNSMREVGNFYRDEITRKGITSWNTLVQYPSENLLDISTPLAISTKRWGTLKVGISLESIRREISSLALKYILYTGLFILFAVLIIAILFRLITMPLKSLAEEMDETKPGDDPPPLSLTSRDEIGILRKSFNRLLRRIKEDEKEKERTQWNLLVTEKMAAIGKLTAGVAHEINNPLGGLLNCIYHFKKGGLSPEKQTEYRYLMEDGIKRIQTAVTNLLEFARTPHAQRSPTELISLVEKAVSLLDYQLRKSRIEVTKEISSSIPLIPVDRNQMIQVFVNVLLNAIQAMEDGGVLKIGGNITDGRVIMSISDTGKGIPEHILSKVFDPFFTTKGEGKGTGLGLWITQGIIERHGGKIQLKSQEGIGTTVEIQLPLHSG
jgi:two-component system, NtrC family, sensor kinase